MVGGGQSILVSEVMIKKKKGTKISIASVTFAKLPLRSKGYVILHSVATG
jgi:hypothetical protein